MSYDKENYITAAPDPNLWRHHPTFRTLQAYNQYIRGNCADFGCNHGALTILCSQFDVDLTVGVDRNLKSLFVAKHLSTEHKCSHKILFLHADLRKVPMIDQTIDFAYSFHTIEHIYPEDIDQVVCEFFRMLKPGGNILIQIPYDHAYPDPCHVAFYTEDSLHDLFERNGFKTLEVFRDDRWKEKELLTGLFGRPDLPE